MFVFLSSAVQSSTHTAAGTKGTGASKTPCSSSAAKTLKNSASVLDGQEDKENNTPPKDGRKTKVVLASSGLEPHQQVPGRQFHQ